MLAMLEHRSTAALAGFLAEQSPAWRRGVKVVVSDGSKAYKSAINTYLSHSRVLQADHHEVLSNPPAARRSSTNAWSASDGPTAIIIAQQSPGRAVCIVTDRFPMVYRIAVTPGDGVGPEVSADGELVLEAAAH